MLSISSNHFLDRLSTDDARLLERHLAVVNFDQGRVIFRTGEIVRRVIFPFTGVVALLVELANGQAVEVGMIGCNGVIGGSAALDGRTTLNPAVVQISVTGAVIDSSTLKNLAEHSTSLRTALLQSELMERAQIQQIAACNAVHGLEQRLCRHLAQARDLIDGDILPLTHESLSQMLGARRSSVTLIAQRLHDLGIIDYRRGVIHVRDAERLQCSACECYRAINDQFDRLIGWQPKVKKLNAASG